MTAELKLPPVAKNIYLECTKCETKRYFRVLAHTSESTAKLECEVCSAKKKFTVGGEKVAKKVKKKRVTRKKVTDADAWAALHVERGDKASIGYNVKKIFTDTDVIAHPKFGVGYITKVHPNKVEVLFEEGSKELIHGRV